MDLPVLLVQVDPPVQVVVRVLLVLVDLREQEVHLVHLDLVV